MFKNTIYNFLLCSLLLYKLSRFNINGIQPGRATFLFEFIFPRREINFSSKEKSNEEYIWSGRKTLVALADPSYSQPGDVRLVLYL
jgi:hypothetical protein